MYYTLIAMSIVAAGARLSRDQLRRYAPAQAHLQIVGWLQLALYAVAYITSALATPLDDQLHYEVGALGLFGVVVAVWWWW